MMPLLPKRYPLTWKWNTTPSAPGWNLAKYLDQLLTDKGLENLEQDVGLWSWLTLFFLGQLCLRGKKPGKDHRYIPEITDFRVSYRHLLRSPYLILRAHADEPDCLACVLANKPDAPGDIYEQFASRQELITNKQLLNAMCKLYVKTEQ
jgi:hypothetical protein